MTPETTDTTSLAKRESKVPIVVEEYRGLVLKTMDDMWRFAEAVHQSGMAPKGLPTTQALFVAIQKGAELGLKPMAAIFSTAVINGRPSLFGDVPLALCRRSGLFDEQHFKEEIEEQDGCVVARCTACRIGGNPTTREFSMKDAQRAGLAKKPGPWQEYPKRMLQMRARAWALKDAFADVLEGTAIREWDELAHDNSRPTPAVPGPVTIEDLLQGPANTQPEDEAPEPEADDEGAPPNTQALSSPRSTLFDEPGDESQPEPLSEPDARESSEAADDYRDAIEGCTASGQAQNLGETVKKDAALTAADRGRLLKLADAEYRNLKAAEAQ